MKDFVLLSIAIEQMRTYTSFTNVASGFGNRLPSDLPYELQGKKISRKICKKYTVGVKEGHG